MPTRRTLLLALSLIAGTAFGSGAAASTMPSVEASNWFYDDPGTTTTGLTSFSVPTTVPTGDLAVGYRDGATAPAAGLPVTLPAAEADKVTALRFALAGVAPGSDVTDFTFAVTVDTANDPASAVAMADPPALVACLSLRMFAGAPGPSPFDQAPAYDCSTKATGVVDAATDTYTFHAAALAGAWVADVNTGLVILPDPATVNPTTFTLSFEPAARITSALSSQPGPAAAPTATGQAGSGTAVEPAPGATPAAPKPGPTRTAATTTTRPPVVPVAAAPVVGGAITPVGAAPGGAAALTAGDSPVVGGSTPPGPVVADPAPAAASQQPGAVPAQGGEPLTRVSATGPLPGGSGGPGPLLWVALTAALLLLFGLTSLGLSSAPARPSAKASRLTELLSRQPS